ncbi:hypothetical protein [Streptosporangium sandarakinum]|uniref:hypothetical protein n=1 Tax=Streptosporangium sandarakinum TaxID=1260955 RepID=UPI00371F90DE
MTAAGAPREPGAGGVADPVDGRSADPGRRSGAARRLAPAFGLFLLAPLVGEYLLGNVPASDIGGLLVLAPMYGGGALVIRETVRRAGRGWPAILLLAAAYGVLEAGVIDQSLFNPSFEGLDFGTETYLPAPGLSASSLLSFVGGHVIWSIGVPVAVVETLAARRGTAPWLGGRGLAVACAVFVLGSVLVGYGVYEGEHFRATAAQTAGAAAVAAVLAGAAFAVGRRPRPASGRASGRRAPGPWAVGAVAWLLSGLYWMRPETWPGVAAGVALAVVAAVVITRWSRRPGWDARHRFAPAGGALPTYACGGFVLLVLKGTATPVNLAGQAVLALGSVLLLAVAARRAGRAAG